MQDYNVEFKRVKLSQIIWNHNMSLNIFKAGPGFLVESKHVGTIPNGDSMEGCILITINHCSKKQT